MNWSPETLGVVCALLAPLAWSVAVILFKQSSSAPPISLNLFKNVTAIVLLSVTMLAFDIGLPTDRSLADWGRLAVSGLLGLAVADTLLFAGLARIGAARLAVVDTVYAPLVVLLAFVVLGERPGPTFLVGAGAVIAGVTLASVERRALSGALGPTVLVGMVYALAAISGTATGVVIARPVLADSALVEVTWTRLVAGVIGQIVWITLRGEWPVATVAFRPGPLWRTLVPAALIGTYLSLMLWLGGFKWAPASTAAVLNQMATVYILVFARVVLKEKLRTAQVAGALLAAGGALWIVMG